MAWAKLATKTLTSAGSNITTDTFTASKFNIFMFHENRTAGNTDGKFRVGNASSDSSSNYADRTSLNGGSDTTDTSQTGMLYHADTTTTHHLSVGYAINISTEEKLFIYWYVNASPTGAGTAPQRREYVGKWTNTSNQFTVMDLYTGGSDQFQIDNNITVLGSDVTIYNIQNGLEFHETDTNKDYVFNSSNNTWYQIT